MNISESDWKKFRNMKNDVLNQNCENIFVKIDQLIEKRKGNEHEIYLKLYRLIREEDRQIEILFDNLKRSNAIQKLAAWVSYGVISKETLEMFSQETQRVVKIYNQDFD